MTDSRGLALVTGASSGIGLELAKQFAERGYDLLINAEEPGLDAAAGELEIIDVNVRSTVHVTVTSLMPGPTETNFFHRAEMDDTRMGAAKKDDPAKVAKDGVEALFDDDQKVVAGSLKTKVTGAAGKVLPDSVKAKAHEKMAEPGSAGGNS